MASSAPPPPAPPPPGYARGTRGYTTAPVFKTGERGSEMIQNPTGAPIRVLNHQQTMAQRQPMMPPPVSYVPGFAAGTDYATWDPATAMSASDTGGSYNTGITNPNTVATAPPAGSYAYSVDPNTLANGLPSTYYDLAAQQGQQGGMVKGGYGGFYTSAELGQGGVNMDVASTLGIPLTAAQRDAINSAASAKYGQGQLGDQRVPSLTGAEINTILQPPTAAQPTQPSPGAASVNATNFPTTYNTANTAAAGTPIVGQTAVSNGYHIDVITGRLVPNAGTTPPPAGQVQPPPTAAQTKAPPAAAAKPLVDPTAVFVGARGYADTAANFPAHGPLTLTPPPATTPTTPTTPATGTGTPPTGTTGGTTTPPPGGTTTGTTPPPAASNGATTPSAIAYDPSVYANLPALQYLKGLVSPQDFANLTSSPSSAGGLGGELPAPNQLNYADLNYLKATDPTGYAVLVALFKARNRDLEQEMQYAQQRAPISNAQNTDTIST